MHTYLVQYTSQYPTWYTSQYPVKYTSLVQSVAAPVHAVAEHAQLTHHLTSTTHVTCCNCFTTGATFRCIFTATEGKPNTKTQIARSHTQDTDYTHSNSTLHTKSLDYMIVTTCYIRTYIH